MSEAAEAAARGRGRGERVRAVQRRPAPRVVRPGRAGAGRGLRLLQREEEHQVGSKWCKVWNVWTVDIG